MIAPALLAEVLAISGDGLVWKRTMGQRAQAGRKAGHTQPNGYVRVRVLGELIMVHRVVWAIHTGRWPNGCIDHINGNPSDNSIENLREATHAQNQANVRVQRNNKSGSKGVYRKKNRWIATIRKEGKTKHLGCFESLQQAEAAYTAASNAIHGEFSVTNSRGIPA